MTTQERCLDIIEAYQDRPDIISHLKNVDLAAVKKELHNKRNLPEYKFNCRMACQEEIEQRKALKRKHETARKKATEIHERLSYQFTVFEGYWKSIENGPSNRREGKIKDNRRAIGQRLYDFTAIPTNLWSVQALINNRNKQENLNVEEHFYSLHANAGQRMLREALAKGIKYDINDYARAVYTYIHIVKTTASENNQLGVYHKPNEMIDPQTSYTACGITPLIYVPKPPTSIQLAWQYLLEELSVDFSKITHPFTNVITVEQAEEWYPTLKVSSPKTESINTSVTVESHIDEK